MFSMLATTPAAESTMSVSILISPEGVLTVEIQPAPLMSTFSTLEFRWISMPIFLYCFASSLEISSSSTGTTFGINSTIVTLVPMLAYTYANSTPIAPEPMTSNDLGCFSKDMALRYSITFWPSMGTLGNCRARPPVAIMILVAVYSVFLPSFSTSTFLPGFTRPEPSMMSILFFFIRKFTPLLIPLATSRLRLITAPKSASALPTVMP